MKAYFADNRGTVGLGQKSTRGGAVLIIARVSMALGQVLSVLCLSRLLSPEDYGLVAMVGVITGFAPTLVDLGTRDAVVQREHITEPEVSALFWITLSVGITFAILTASAGPLIARFYREPRLIGIAGVSSLNFVVISLINQHQALMRRGMMFRELAMIEVGANVLSACGAIVLAYFGLGYWALVTRSLSMYCLMAVAVWWSCGWLPGRPAFTSGVKNMLRFGLYLTASTLFDFGGRNADRAVIGKTLGAKVLGWYQQALFVYSNLMDVLVLTLHQVAIVGLSKLIGDRDEFRRCWAKALSTVSFFAMAAFGLLAVTSQDLIVLLLGQRWAMAGSILSILALRGIPHAVERTTGWLYVATNTTDRCVRYNVVAMVCQIVALVCGLPFGPTGVAISYTILMFVLFVPALVYAGRPVQISAADVMRVVGRPLSGSLIAAALAFAMRQWMLGEFGALERTLIIGVSYLAVYYLLVVGIFNVRGPLEVLRSVVRGFLPARLSFVGASGDGSE